MNWKGWLVLCTLIGCSTGNRGTDSSTSSEYPYGLFKITETDCSVPPGEPNYCKDLRFIEIVKGKFSEIGPNETALVTWRECGGGEVEILCYEAQKINKTPLVSNGDGQVILIESEDDLFIEKTFLEEKEGILGLNTDLERKHKKRKNTFRNFNYTLELSNRKEALPYLLHYPQDVE